MDFTNHGTISICRYPGLVQVYLFLKFSAICKDHEEVAMLTDRGLAKCST